jgi:hypothetical protein
MTASPRTTIKLPPAPEAPPREITPGVMRRSLMEPRVRFWWLTAGVLFLVALYFLVDRSLNWIEELHIIRNGTSVSATITQIGADETAGRSNVSPDNEVDLQYDFGGNTYHVNGFLEGRTESISLKQVVPIKIDPDKPDHWTYLSDVPPLTHVLLSAGLVAPFAIAAGVVGFIRRRRVLRIWRQGVANPFVVETIRQTALAPSSRFVGCRSMEGRVLELVWVFIPRRIADPKRGDVLWLIHAPMRTTMALPALAYEERRTGK